MAFLKKFSGRTRFEKGLYLSIAGILFLSFPQTVYCQSSQKPIQMGPVLQDSIQISGNYGELRSNHFHSGIDFKTGEKEGKPVYAAADGYISRIKVSSMGYGKAVYITHPNNIVTVYGHLRIFYPALEDTIKRLQTDAGEYEIELFPDSAVFPLEKGTLIGYSGNSGSSEGPHLHFETRNRFTEKPFNPEMAGYFIEDTIPPQIKAIAIYDPGPFDGLAGSSKQLIEISPESNFGPTDTLTIAGDQFFMGFESHEMAGAETNLIGIRAVNLYLDDSLIFNARIDSFSFDETRMINATIDYPFYGETGRKLVLCHVLKGNRLSFLVNKNGLIRLKNFSIHKLKLRIEDTAGNHDEKSLFVRKTGDVMTPPPKKESVIYRYGTPLNLTTANSRVSISPSSFYEDLSLELIEKISPNLNSTLLSPIVTLSPVLIPVQDPITISIKPDFNSTDFASKLIAVQIDSTGQLSGLKSKYEDGWIVFKTKDMGDYSVTYDTIPPISKTPFWEPDEYTGANKLIIELVRDLSGIGSSKCFINGSWTISDFNANKSRITVYPEDIPKIAGSLQVIVELIDRSGNQGIYVYPVAIKK